MYDPALPRSRVFLPAILSGVLLYISFFPVNAGFLGWVALVPLLSLINANARPRRIYFATFVGGLVFYVPAIQWMRVAHPAMYGAWLFLAFCCALFLVMSLWLTRKLIRVGMPGWLAVPIAFVAMEYFRSHFPTGYTWMEFFNARNPIGFGWYMLGHTQHDWSPMIQVADLAGVYAVSFLVALVNVTLWLMIEQNALLRVWLRHIKDPVTSLVRPLVVTSAFCLATWIYGFVRLQDNTFLNGPRVALLQGNLEQDAKNEHGSKLEEHFVLLADKAAYPPPGQQKPDLIVWPETSLVVPWHEVGSGLNLRDLDRKYRDAGSLAERTPEQQRYWRFREGLSKNSYFTWAAERWEIPSLFGTGGVQWEADGREWRYNSAVMIDRDGKSLGRYDKMHLVPLGEYVPMVETLPFMKMFTPYEGDYSCKPGSTWMRFPLKVGDRTYHFACIICYEDTDASLARHYVRPGEEGVDFFVNISNDGWFQGTEEHEQHLAICRFRAIETRRSVVRAVNMGISAIIDPTGRVIALPGPTWAESKKIDPVVLTGQVPIGTATTLYARFGDWLPVACWFVLIGGFVRGFILRRRAKNAVAAS